MRTKLTIAAFLCCLFCLSLSAAPSARKKQQPERPASAHYVGPYLMAGYDNMFKSDSHLRNIGGPMGGIGAAYRYRYGTFSKGAFLLNAGVEAQYGMNIRKGTFGLTRRVLYPSNEMFLAYQFRDLKETQTALDVSLSLMAGGSYQNLFVLAGVRLGYPVMASYSVRSDVDRVILDARGIDDYTQMPQHLLGSDLVNGNGSLAKRFCPFVALEVGYDFFKPSVQQPAAKGRNQQPPKRTFKDYAHWQLSAFANVGVSDYKPVASEPLVTFDGATSVSQLQSTSHAAEFAAARTIPFIVGLKCALMFELPGKRPAVQKESNPYIVTYVRDEVTDLPVTGATVTTRSAVKGKKKKKPVVRTTDEIAGCVAKTYAPGKYLVSAKADGYFPSKQIAFNHEDRDDTIRIALYPQKPLRSQVIDAKTQRAVTAHVTVFTEKGDTVISGRVDSIETVLSTLVDDRQRYYACVTAEGYRDTCANFTQISEVLVIRLEPIQVKRFVLQNMFFATDKTDILPTSDAALQELYTLLNDNPDIRIRIIGHTDDVGKDDYNLRLSRGRSESVKKEMVKRGIASERIETAGRGELDPIVPNDSDEHRQMNRRVEIEILSGGSVQLQIRDEQLTK